MRLDAPHRQHLAANGEHENQRNIYCTNVHLRIIEILITLMYKLSAVTAAVTLEPSRPGRPKLPEWQLSQKSLANRRSLVRSYAK